MRQALPMRRQAVLLVARHLAEGAVVAVGQEHRVVAEAGVAARRPDQRAVDVRLELLDMAVRPGDAERGDELRLAQRRPVGAVVAAAWTRSSAMARAKFLSGPAQRAEWMPGAPPSASTARPESSAKAGRPAAFAAASRLDARVVARSSRRFRPARAGQARPPTRPRYRRARAVRASRAACRDCGWR